MSKIIDSIKLLFKLKNLQRRINKINARFDWLELERLRCTAELQNVKQEYFLATGEAIV